MTRYQTQNPSSYYVVTSQVQLNWRMSCNARSQLILQHQKHNSSEAVQRTTALTAAISVYQSHLDCIVAVLVKHAFYCIEGKPQWLSDRCRCSTTNRGPSVFHSERDGGGLLHARIKENDKDRKRHWPTLQRRLCKHARRLAPTPLLSYLLRISQSPCSWKGIIVYRITRAAPSIDVAGNLCLRTAEWTLDRGTEVCFIAHNYLNSRDCFLFCQIKYNIKWTIHHRCFWLRLFFF